MLYILKEVTKRFVFKSDSRKYMSNATGTKHSRMPHGKAITTTLDRLPFGDADFLEKDRHKTKKERKELPENVTSKEMYSDVLKIAWPSLTELLLTSLTSMIDMIMVSNLGTFATSAVGLAQQPRFLFNTVVQAVNTGSTALVARSRGKGEVDMANNVMRHSMLFSVVLAVICSILGVICASPLIRFMSSGGISESTIQLGIEYLQIQMYGFGFMVLTTTITAVLRGSGNSKPAMYYNVTVNIVKIIANLIMIPTMGIPGAAYATIISQGVGMFFAFYYLLCGKYYLKLTFERFHFNYRVISDMCKVGLPAMLEQAIMRVGMIIFSRTIASLGEVAMATHQICMNIQSLSMMNGQALAVSATTLIGQSLGRKRPDMAEHYGRKCRSVAFWISVCLAVVFALSGKYIILLYNHSDPEVLALGSVIMYFVAVTQPFQSSQFVIAGALRGAGDTKSIAVIMLVTVVIIRAGLASLFVNVFHLGIYGAWTAMSLDQLTRSGLVMLRYNQGKWKDIKLLE